MLTATAYPPHAGLLSDAASHLGDLVHRARRLANETDWQCAAARAYRTDLAGWIDLVRALKADVEALEWDARAAAGRMAGAAG